MDSGVAAVCDTSGPSAPGRRPGLGSYTGEIWVPAAGVDRPAERSVRPRQDSRTSEEKGLLFFIVTDKDEEKLWALEKWKSKNRIPTFPPPRMPAAQGKERPFTQNA